MQSEQLTWLRILLLYFQAQTLGKDSYLKRHAIFLSVWWTGLGCRFKCQVPQLSSDCMALGRYLFYLQLADISKYYCRALKYNDLHAECSSFPGKHSKSSCTVIWRKKKVKTCTQIEKNYFATVKKPCWGGMGTAGRTVLAVSRFSQLLNCLAFSMKKDKVWLRKMKFTAIPWLESGWQQGALQSWGETEYTVGNRWVLLCGYKRAVELKVLWF